MGCGEFWSDDSVELGCLREGKAPIDTSKAVRAAILIRDVPGDERDSVTQGPSLCPPAVILTPPAGTVSPAHAGTVCRRPRSHLQSKEISQKSDGLGGWYKLSCQVQERPCLRRMRQRVTERDIQCPRQCSAYVCIRHVQPHSHVHIGAGWFCVPA